MSDERTKRDLLDEIERRTGRALSLKMSRADALEVLNIIEEGVPPVSPLDDAALEIFQGLVPLEERQQLVREAVLEAAKSAGTQIGSMVESEEQMQKLVEITINVIQETLMANEEIKVNGETITREQASAKADALFDAVAHERKIFAWNTRSKTITAMAGVASVAALTTAGVKKLRGGKAAVPSSNGEAAYQPYVVNE